MCSVAVVVNMAFANVRRVMMKHKRGAKCPLLEKFLSECVEEDVGQFVATSDIYEAYGSAVSVWTDGDSVNGQTKFLIKKSGFNKVSIYAANSACITVVMPLQTRIVSCNKRNLSSKNC